MAAMAVSAQSTERPWISPQEQLERLIKVDRQVVTEVTSVLPAALAEVVAKCLGELPSRLSDWYTGLERFKMLPKIIPPLPVDICDQLKPSDKLYRIPPGSMNQFAKQAQNYGSEHLEEYGGQNPFRFMTICRSARQQGDTWFDKGTWVIISDDLFKTGYDTSYQQHAEAVAALGQEIPTLFVMVATILLHGVATKQAMLPINNVQNRNDYAYTRVQEAGEGGPLAVGIVNSQNLLFVGPSEFGPVDDIGIVGMRRF